MQWIVEGTQIASFRAALLVAQLVADTRQNIIPVILDRGNELAIVRMVEPRSI